MKQHDIARIYGLCALADHIVRAQILPVKRINVPLHAFIAFLAADTHDSIVILAIGWTEKRRWLACNRLYQIAAPPEFLSDLRLRQLRHMRVCRRMVADFMPSGDNFRHQIGMFLCPESDKKERRSDIILIQNIQDFFRIGAPPCSIKADGKHLFFCIDIINREFARRHRSHHCRRIPHGYVSQKYCAQQYDRQHLPDLLEIEALLFHTHRRHLLLRKFI